MWTMGKRSQLQARCCSDRCDLNCASSNASCTVPHWHAASQSRHSSACQWLHHTSACAQRARSHRIWGRGCRASRTRPCRGAAAQRVRGCRVSRGRRLKPEDRTATNMRMTHAKNRHAKRKCSSPAWTGGCHRTRRMTCERKVTACCPSRTRRLQWPQQLQQQPAKRVQAELCGLMSSLTHGTRHKPHINTPVVHIVMHREMAEGAQRL